MHMGIWYLSSACLIILFLRISLEIVKSLFQLEKPLEKKPTALLESASATHVPSCLRLDRSRSGGRRHDERSGPYPQRLSAVASPARSGVISPAIEG